MVIYVLSFFPSFFILFQLLWISKCAFERWQMYALTQKVNCSFKNFVSVCVEHRVCSYGWMVDRAALNAYLGLYQRVHIGERLIRFVLFCLIYSLANVWFCYVRSIKIKWECSRAFLSFVIKHTGNGRWQGRAEKNITACTCLSFIPHNKKPHQFSILCSVCA